MKKKAMKIVTSAKKKMNLDTRDKGIMVKHPKNPSVPIGVVPEMKGKVRKKSIQ